MFLTKSVISWKATKNFKTRHTHCYSLTRVHGPTTYLDYEVWNNYFIERNMKFYSLFEHILGRRMATRFHFC